MKAINKFIFALCFTAILLTSTSCLNDDPFVDWGGMGVVIELPYKSHYVTLQEVVPAENETFDLLVNYSISTASDNQKDIPVQLGINESLVEVYNSTLSNSAQKYKLLPAGTYTLPTVTIKKGTRLWQDKMEIETSSLTPGERYILPIIIAGAPEGYTVSGNFGHLYVRVLMK